MKLLIVDDSELLLERISVAVAAIRPDIAIFRSQSLAEALRACREVRPDAVVLDIQLPDGNGYELLTRIKEDAPGTRVMILSNHPFYRKKCIDAGADWFFDKSGEIDSFLETIRRLGKA